MNRTTTLIGYAVLASAIVGQQLAAVRARSHGRSARPSTGGEFLTELTRWPPVRWLLVAGWLWVGWHVFVRVDWR